MREDTAGKRGRGVKARRVETCGNDLVVEGQKVREVDSLSVERIERLRDCDRSWSDS